jgi:cell division protein FtsW
MVWTTPNRLNRVLGFAADLPVVSSWVHVETLPGSQKRDIEAKKMQQHHAELAFGSGSWDGVGPGNGRMKLYSLPEAHTDFILAMVGEELGLNCTLWIVLCFGLLVVGGVKIANDAPDRFGRLLGFGLAFLLGIQGLVNMGVVTSLLPNKGLALPFVSYGRSSLLMSLVCIGILCNIHLMGGRALARDSAKRRGGERRTPVL